MNRILLTLSVFVSILSYSQTDSTDLSYSMTDPILLDEMDSLMFDASEFGELYIDFDVTDTISFDGINVEILTSEDNVVLYKELFSKLDLLNSNLLDANWHCSIGLGKLEKNVDYTILFVVKDFNGAVTTNISKHFIYATN